MKDIKEFFIFLLVLMVIFVGLLLVLPKVLPVYNRYIDDNSVSQLPQISEEEKYFDKLTEDIILCESSGNPNAVGDLNYPHHAFGLIQVQIRTWKWLGEKMGFNGDINNPEDQRQFLRLALEKGFGGYWSCYRRIKRQAL